MQKSINSLNRTEIENFVSDPGAELDRYQALATRSAIYPGQGTPLGLAYCALKMNGEAGEFAEHVGKAMRDDNMMAIAEMDDGLPLLPGDCLTPERRQLLIKEIGDVLWYLSAACNELNITLQEAAAQNLLKLVDRHERNALRGSGDER